MKRLVSFCLALAAAPLASAASWTVGVDAGPSRLDANGADHASSHAAESVRLDWWLAPGWALEGSVVHAQTTFRVGAGNPFLDREVDRDLDAFRVGARGRWTLDDTFFVDARAGLDYSRIDSERVSIRETGPHTAEIRFDRDYADQGPYLGVGLGWRWNERWSSSVEYTRMFGNAGYECHASGNCDSMNRSHFDTATVGLAYDFD